MGDIVEFRAFTSNRISTDTAVPVGGAQILFFLGIRYERHEPAAPAPKRIRKRKARKAAPAPESRVPASGPKRKTTRKRA